MTRRTLFSLIAIPLASTWLAACNSTSSPASVSSVRVFEGPN